jgi:hypothetical protein
MCGHKVFKINIFFDTEKKENGIGGIRWDVESKQELN